jgi:hypothetical protein
MTFHDNDRVGQSPSVGLIIRQRSSRKNLETPMDRLDSSPIFPPPEVLDNVQNVVGYAPAQTAPAGTTGVTASNGQVGNLGLTAAQEAFVVNFLKILSDGYTKPNPVDCRAMWQWAHSMGSAAENGSSPISIS